MPKSNIKITPSQASAIEDAVLYLAKDLFLYSNDLANFWFNVNRLFEEVSANREVLLRDLTQVFEEFSALGIDVEEAKRYLSWDRRS